MRNRPCESARYWLFKDPGLKPEDDRAKRREVRSPMLSVNRDARLFCTIAPGVRTSDK